MSKPAVPVAPDRLKVAEAPNAAWPLSSRRAPGRPKPDALTRQSNCTCGAKRRVQFD
jgi:hypothetical protein